MARVPVSRIYFYFMWLLFRTIYKCDKLSIQLHKYVFSPRNNYVFTIKCLLVNVFLHIYVLWLMAVLLFHFRFQPILSQQMRLLSLHRIQWTTAAVAMSYTPTHCSSRKYNYCTAIPQAWWVGAWYDACVVSRETEGDKRVILAL